MEPAATLEDLAEQIAAAAKTVGSFLTSNGFPQPSFAKDAALEFPSAPEDILIARRKLREATKTLHDLVVGPSESLRWLACNVVILRPSYGVCC